eukprot:ANDGO_07021.mRNA.1 stress responsive alphabeta barrel domain protein
MRCFAAVAAALVFFAVFLQTSSAMLALHHFVFFSFSASTSPDSIQSVVDKFRDLKNQIPYVLAFENGINNSPEGLNKSFTHVFRVVFSSTADRDFYAFHDPHHLAFKAYALTIVSNVFLFDMWADYADPVNSAADYASNDNQLLRHIVLFDYRPDALATVVQQTTGLFRALRTEVAYCQNLASGVNNSPEGLSGNFSHGFEVTFTSQADRDNYVFVEPHHQAFKAFVGPILNGGANGVIVLDYWASPKLSDNGDDSHSTCGKCDSYKVLTVVFGSLLGLCIVSAFVYMLIKRKKSVYVPV